MKPMHGVIARGLVVLFSFLLIGPCVFVSDPQSTLPPCCRRNGKHHCGMAERAVERANGAGVGSVSTKCPLFPRSVPASHPMQFLVPRAMQAGIRIECAAYVHIDAQFNASSARGHRQRGPPQFSIS